ncbi:hypothetical protein K2173_023076 [Erythroxylum novogranatense]|uniref:signal peptidase I n=1 Tax=Erythroxylum novogranatense TaxID=1862640 RepID=A0AAV8T8G2_9ROSI|nr:hypothetical protein K2173_023076 [Erythroxylum novogranatense]
MSCLRPSVLLQFLTTFISVQWMPCQSWGFLRWPGFDGFMKLFVLALLWSTFSEIRYITSSSMSPTIGVGDRVLIEKAKYYFRNPSRNDIVTFRAPKQPRSREEDVFIKRIVAKAGDYVQVQHGSLYVNGIAQNEDFTAERPTYTSSLTCVPKGHVYVLGDNRNNSYDSHHWGPLPVKNIIGRYVMRFHKPSKP